MSGSIAIVVNTEFLEEQSAPEDHRFVFAYTIRIINEGTQAARLLRRYWVITDANGDVQEVRGDGVVGEQPHLQPGDEFEYTSGAVLPTPMGVMRGSYQMQNDDGSEFDAPIAAFTLTIPRTLH
jgi:ApaG protein